MKAIRLGDHPAIPSGNVYCVHAVLSHLRLSRHAAGQRAVAATRFTTVPDMQKALSHRERASTCGNW